MSRYIDADTFDVFHYKKTEDIENTFDDGVQFVLEKIDEEPTEDVAPVKHGYWMLLPDFVCECTNCGEQFVLNNDDYGRYFYCPHCGAKMD